MGCKIIIGTLQPPLICLNRNHISAVLTRRVVVHGRSTSDPIRITINYCTSTENIITKAGKIVIFSHNIIPISRMKTELPTLLTAIPIFKIIICTATKITILIKSIRIWTKWTTANSFTRTTRILTTIKRTWISRIAFKTRRTISKSHATNIKITIINTSPTTCTPINRRPSKLLIQPI